MPYKNIKCRILEEEIRAFWPQWHVVKQISEGAFGAVYEIHKEECGVQFRSALKVLNTAGGENLLPTASLLQQNDFNEGRSGGKILGGDNSQREESGKVDVLPEAFRNEIKIMESLRGAPNVVTMEDVHFQTDGYTGILYIRMELLTSLQSYVRGRPSLSVPEIIQIGIDVCKALAFCEDRHVIHRDIKPANLYIDEFGTCKVGDFGASRWSETVHAANMMTGIGTISYMAPEIYYGKPYNNTVDLYALGLVLYQLLNRGRMPFMPAYPKECSTADIDISNYKRLHGEEIPQLLFAEHYGDAIGPYSSENTMDSNYLYSESAHALDKVIRKACSYRVENRYRTALEMSYALDACRHTSARENKAVPETLAKRKEISGKSTDTPQSLGQDLGTSTGISYVNAQETGAKADSLSSLKQENDPNPARPNNPQENPDQGERTSIIRWWSKYSNNRKFLIGAVILAVVCLVCLISVQKNRKNVTADWKEIVIASEDGTYLKKYRIGDTVKLDLGEAGTIMMELVAMNADELADGSGKAHMTWISKELLKYKHAMNIDATSEGGWMDSDMRFWLRESILPLFPEILRANIQEVTKYSYSFSEKGTISSADSIWIPSRREVFGADIALEDEGAVYTGAYSNDLSRQKICPGTTSTSAWWLRSVYDDNEFFTVNGGGSSSSSYSSSERGVAVGFCF